jgi:5-methylcytosine-specific restriction endonuclease McrA
MTKICKTCGQDKPLDAFDPGGPKNRPGYRGLHCKECRNTIARTKHKQNPSKRRLNSRRFRERHPETIQAWDKGRWQKMKQRYESDPDFHEHEKQRVIAYAQAHTKQKQENDKRWKATHPEQALAIRQRSRQRQRIKDPNYHAKRRALGRRFYANHRETEMDRARQRRAKLRGAAMVETIHNQRIFERDGWICQLCFKPVTPDDASIDHVIPVAEGGNHTYQNLVTTHLSCNQRKGARRIPQQQRLFG